MAINFPNTPAIGEEYTAGGFTWVWTGSAWEKVAEATAVANDFVLVVGSTGNTTYVLERPYSAGRYFIDFVNNDTSYDIYFIAEDGTLAGYTSTDSALVTESFEEVVVLGAANNEIITFTYQGVSTEPSSAGDVAVAGAFINSVATANLPNVDDTTVVNGGNFAADVEVSFIGTNEVETAAKSVVRNSSTELLVTRPDSFSTANSPYDVKVLNPGIPAPTGSNRHILFNSVTAGTNPAWVTGTTVFYNLTQPTSITLLATDTEASDIDYTIVTGTLPAGLSLDGETGVISGTFSGSASEGAATNVTFRATDAGGNFVNRAIDLVANASPVWTTAAGAITNAQAGSAYSFQLVASTGSAGGTLSYSLQSGSLPAGITLSSTGLISGTASSTGTSNFTVRVTDQANAFTDRAFSLAVTAEFLVEYLVIAGGGGGGANSCSTGGGGGAGGYRSSVVGENSGRLSAAESRVTVAQGSSYTVTVGAGGAGEPSTQNTFGADGSASVFWTITSTGGGGGAGGAAGCGSAVGRTGGSGGGASQNTTGGLGTANQGFDGSRGKSDLKSYSSGGGGGGAGANAVDAIGGGDFSQYAIGGDAGIGITSSITGSAISRAGGGGGASSGSAAGSRGGNGASGGGNGGRQAAGTSATVNSGSGGGGSSNSGTTGGNGGSGIVIIRYPSTYTANLGAGLTGSTTTVGANKVTTITAGTGTVSWS